MRILMAGASGFLGSHLSDLLLEQGHEVVGVDNYITGRRENVAHLDGKPGWSHVEHDIIKPID
ncbi:MAG: NAD-dependent epimerase/dehydratase family protein, partial [Planctomycetota bacterium]